MAGDETTRGDEPKIESIGDSVTDEIESADDGEVVGIASYSQDERRVHYRDDDSTDGYTEAAVQEILDQIRLETIGVPAVADLHGTDLRAFARFYEGLDTVVVPVSETAGVVVARRSGADRTVEDVVETVETATEATLGERDASAEN